MTISADEMKTPGFIFSSYFFLKYISSLKTFKLKISTDEINLITTWNPNFVWYHVSVNFGVNEKASIWESYERCGQGIRCGFEGRFVKSIFRLDSVPG